MPPRLHPQLEIIRTGPRQYLLRLSRGGEAFLIGWDERQLVDLLDGRRDAEALARDWSVRLGRPVSETNVESFLTQLAAAGFLAAEPTAGPSAADAASSPQPAAWPDGSLAWSDASPRSAGSIAPLSADDPAANLNHFFDWLVVLLGWMLHPAWLVVLAALVVLGGATIYQHFDRYGADIVWLSGQTVFWQRIVVFVLLVLVAVSLPRALLMGMATRAFGGRVRHFGLHVERRVLPYFDCDVGDSLTRMTTGQQWALLTLGIWSQFLVGSLCLLGWALAPQRSVLGNFFLLVIPHCVLGVLLRFNPLARSDAYALLCFWTKEHQLMPRAQAQCRAWLTVSTPPEALDPAKRHWFRWYGLGTYAWDALLAVVLIGGGGWLLTTQMRGPGALLGCTLVGLWFSDDLGKRAMSYSAVRWLVRGGGRWYVRWTIRLALLAGLIACGFLPYRHEVGGDFRLVPQAEHGLRAGVEGELVELPFREGDRVEAGQLVARIDDSTLASQLEASRHALEGAQAQLDLLNAGPRTEDVEAARQKMELAAVRLEYYDREFVRIEGLARTNTVSPAELANAQFERDSSQKMYAAAKEELAKLEAGTRPEEIRGAEAEVARLEAEERHYEKELTRTRIVAPMPGRIVTTNVEARLGTYVQPGELVAVIQETDRLEAEIAAMEDAAAYVEPGQEVHLRFWGLHGALVRGRVTSKSATALEGRKLEIDRVRTDREEMAETVGTGDDSRYIWVTAELAEPPANLVPEMTGKARIVIGDDTFWRALARPVLRFFRVEVWSWLP